MAGSSAVPTASEWIESGLVLSWLADADVDALDAIVDLYWPFTEGPDAAVLRGSLIGLRAATTLLRGDLEAALASAEQALPLLADVDPSGLWYPPWLTAALTVGALGRAGGTETYLLPGRRDSVAGGSIVALWARADAWSLAASGDLVSAASGLLGGAADMTHAPGDAVILLHEALRLGAPAPEVAAMLPDAVLDGWFLPRLRDSIRARATADGPALSALGQALEQRGLMLLAAEHAAWAAQAQEAVGSSAAPAERRALLRRLAACPTAQTPPLQAGVPTLSRREAEVAVRLAAGEDNRSIAASLVVSQRTVEWHVRQLYVKTGAVDRPDLRQLLRLLLSRARQD